MMDPSAPRLLDELRTFTGDPEVHPLEVCLLGPTLGVTPFFSEVHSLGRFAP